MAPFAKIQAASALLQAPERIRNSFVSTESSSDFNKRASDWK